MVFLIIFKELRSNILTLRFGVIYGLLFVLTVVSMTMLSANYRTQQENYARAKERQREILSSMEDLNDLRYQGATVQKPPSELTPFSMGLEKEMSRTLTVSGRRGIEVGAGQYTNPISALFSTPDLSYIVNIVISLLALLLTFDTICGERETGTLRLMLANSVPRSTILVAKWLGGYLGLAVPFLLAVGAGLVVSLLLTGSSPDADSWMRAGGLVLLSLLYISVFFTLGVLISTFNRRSSTALMASLFVWVVIVVTIPNMVPILARQVVGIPSLGMMSERKEAIEREQWQSIRQRMRNATSDSARRQIRNEMRSGVSDEVERIQNDYRGRIDAQIELAQVLSRLSPSASFVYAATNLSATGVKNFRDLAAYAEKTYGSQFRSVVDELRREERRSSSRGQRNVEQTIDTPTFDAGRLPEFRPPTESFARSLQRSMLDVGLLGIFNIVFLLVSYIKFMRYDVCE
jgi:ABC-type transport system involved in multi-copper enzyme maturation permease subunit